MSQYRDPFIGGGEGARNRNNEGYMYRRHEEDDGFQYSPTSGDTSYGFPAVPTTDMGGRPTSRPTQQLQRPQQPMSSRQGGHGVQSFPASPVPREPGNNHNGSRGPPPRPVRSNYIPSNLDSSEVQEVQQNSNFSYRLNKQPVRAQAMCSQPSDDGDPTNPPANRPSVSNSRSVFIGFDPSNSLVTTNTNSLGVIPNFPPVPPPITSGLNRKPSGAGPPPSARRGTPSYYSQQALMVSPIPEESLSDRHESYASSTAIPSGWSAEPVGYYNRDDAQSDIDEYEPRMPIDSYVDVEEERGLVRQASLGRKSRPVITEIKGSDRLKSVEGSGKSGSNQSFKTGRRVGGSGSIGGATSISPAEKSSPTSNPIMGGSLPSVAGPQAQSPVSSTTGSDSSITQPPAAYKINSYMGERFNFSRRASQMDSPAFELQPTASSLPSTELPAPAGAMVGRRIPPRLNMDAVRDAEARGSLTSLPDLIRRATKLAAVLETGRPDSRWGTRSYNGSSSASRSNGRDTDSISDILASFPPPALAQGRNRGTRALSQWPLPGDCSHENDSSTPSQKQGRRICGLPMWAFVLLVILALLVISAAVIVPLQLVNLSKGRKANNNNSGSTLVAQCKEKNPCQNGGENVATSEFCGCVCTNGFTGSNCTKKDDQSCTTVDLKDRKSGQVNIQNVTLGNALPRLFNKAGPSYNIELDMAIILVVFSNESISCTAQNALVTFNVPANATTGRRALVGVNAAFEKRQSGASTVVGQTPTATAATATTSGTAISTESRIPELDPDAVDFARVVLLYLIGVQTLSVVSEAQGELQSEFSAGIDFGYLSVGNNITVDFDNRSIELPGGGIVGGITANSTNTTTTSSTKNRRSVFGTYLGILA